MENLERWMKIRYRLIKDEFKNEFTKQDVENHLRKKGKSISNLNELLSVLVKAKYLSSKRDTKDSRRTIYKIIEKEENITELTQSKLISLLKEGANLIRLRMDYKILLILLFYKSLSDAYKKRVEKYLREGVELEDAYHLVNTEYFIFYDESISNSEDKSDDSSENKLYTWEETVKDKITIIKTFVEALNKISSLNSKLKELGTLTERLGFSTLSTNEDNLHIFLDLIDLFNKIDFSNTNFDVIGKGYEWILSYFASLNIKEGELFTPKEVIKLMVKSLDIVDNSSVLDPASGSCSILIESRKEYGTNKIRKVEGQEYSQITSLLGRVNLIIHGIENYETHYGDSLINQKFRRADYVIANPPWNQKGYDEDKLKREDLLNIYSRGFTSKNSADWSWVQLMNYYSRKKVAVILDSGALFRGGKEEIVRKKFLEDDLIETIILLPEKLFYNTQAPGIILILNKNKKEDRKNKVQFINLTNEFIKHPEIKKLNSLSDEKIEETANIIKFFKEVEYFSKIIDLSEIKKNNFSLNVSLYINPKDNKEKIVLGREHNILNDLKNKEKFLEQKSEEYIKKLVNLEERDVK